MGTEKAHATAQGSHVLGSSKEKAYSTISLETKTAADIFNGSDSEWLHKRTTTARTIWVKLRSHAFYDEVVSGWSDEEWKQNFRVSRETFKVLCNKLKPSLERRMVTRQPLLVEQRIAVTLRRLGTNVEFRTISHLFAVGILTACVTVWDVCSAIVEKLAPRFITVPCGNELEAVVEGFLSRWGFPQCVGAIDGSHISLCQKKMLQIISTEKNSFCCFASTCRLRIQIHGRLHWVAG